jgi:two-component system response regulator VicR
MRIELRNIQEVSMHRILIVDDELEVAKALRRLLRKEYEIEIAANGEEALAKLDAFRPDVVLSDFRMPGMSGAELLSAVKARMPLSLRLILSGYADLDSVLASVNEGEICRFLRKPWDDAELKATLHRLLQTRELLSQLHSPFAQAAAIQTDSRQDDAKIALNARLTGTTFTAAQAVDVISKFAGAIESAQFQVVGGLLERHGGRICFTAQVGGGEQKLTLELPIAPRDASSAKQP